MEIYEALDEMDELIQSASRIPLTGKCMIDLEAMLECLDRIRTMLPEEIRQARWVTREKERLIKEAQEEAQRQIGEAKRHIERLAAESEVVRQAQYRAEEILAQAQAVAKEIRAGAAAYADEVLGKMEQALEKSITAVREGRNELRQPPKTQTGQSQTVKTAG